MSPGHKNEASLQTVLLVLLIMLFCGLQAVWLYRADPWHIFHWQSDKPIRDYDLFDHLRFHKPMRMRALSSPVLVLGSSRAARLAPVVEVDQAGLPPYNAALPGATLYELRAMLEHAIAIGGTEHVILAIDQSMLRPLDPPYRTGFQHDRQLIPSPGPFQLVAQKTQYLTDLWHALVSRGSLSMALEQARSGEHSQRVFLANGIWFGTDDSKSRRFRENMVVKNELERQQALVGTPDFTELARIISLCRDRGIDLTLVMMPLQGRVLVTIEDAGGWQRYLDDHRALIRFVEESGSSAVVFGFEHNWTIVGDADSGTRWFEDGRHLTREGGARIAACVASVRCAKEAPPATLSENTIDEYLKAVEANVRRYRALAGV